MPPQRKIVNEVRFVSVATIRIKPVKYRAPSSRKPYWTMQYARFDRGTLSKCKHSETGANAP